MDALYSEEKGKTLTQPLQEFLFLTALDDKSTRLMDILADSMQLDY